MCGRIDLTRVNRTQVRQAASRGDREAAGNRPVPDVGDLATDDGESGDRIALQHYDAARRQQPAQPSDGQRIRKRAQLRLGD